MREINIKTIIISIVINFLIILTFTSIYAESTGSSQGANTIICKYEEQPNGKIILDFNDCSWSVINHQKGTYIFSPAFMEDSDITFKSYEDLQRAIKLYYKDKDITVIKNKFVQSLENETLNPDNYTVVERELNKVPAAVKELLINNNVEILLQDDIITREENKETYGLYFWDYNQILLDTNNYSIEYALIHEIGHALDGILDLESNSVLMESYKANEIIYQNEHFNSSLREYIAQGIYEYYNNTLNVNTKLYKELNSILSVYS